MHQKLYTFSDNLCRICKKQQISIDTLAEAIGKSPRQISRYRNGQCKNISLDTLIKIASVLNVSLSDLFE